MELAIGNLSTFQPFNFSTTDWRMRQSVPRAGVGAEAEENVADGGKALCRRGGWPCSQRGGDAASRRVATWQGLDVAGSRRFAALQAAKQTGLCPLFQRGEENRNVKRCHLPPMSSAVAAFTFRGECGILILRQRHPNRLCRKHDQKKTIYPLPRFQILILKA